MARTRVSIVTPTYNYGRFLEEAILSVLDQADEGVEYIVIDGGSTDETLELLGRYAHRMAYWRSQPDSGQSQAINHGWSVASGDVIAWLNADDAYEPGGIARAVAVLDARPDVDLVYSDCLMVDEVGRRNYRRHAFQQDLVSLLVDGDYIPQPTVFLRKSLLDRIGWVNEALDLVMDYELWLRVFTVGRALYLEHECLARARLHSGAKSVARQPQFARELVKALDIYYARGIAPPRALAVRRKAYGRYLFACADKALTVERDPARSLFWLARAIVADPSSAGRVPRALVRLAARKRNLEHGSRAS